MVGYEKNLSIKIQGAAQQPRETLVNYLKTNAADVASVLNEIHTQRTL